MILLLLLACEPLDPDDCAWFEDCARFVPEGALCGLAHYRSGHYGGSCRAADGRDYDPAVARRTDGLISATEVEATPCPDGFTSLDVSDLESSSTWKTCSALGNRSGSGGEWRDMPAGTACGLSSLQDTDEATCEGFRPRLGECPEGTRWRWVPDAVNDRLDGDCQRDESYSSTPIAIPLTFCEVTADGCTDDCPPEVLAQSYLCGLHARGGFMGPLDIASNPTRDMDQDVPVADLSARFGAHIAECGGLVDALPEALLPQIVDDLPSNLEASCMGKPVVEGCPAGMQMLCTTDWTGSTGYFTYTGLCWCSAEGTAQYLPEYDDGA